MAAAEDEYDQTMDPEDTIGEATFIYTNSRASRDQINEAREQGWSLYQHPAEGQKWEEGEDDKPMEPDRQGLPSQMAVNQRDDDQVLDQAPTPSTKLSR